ncbi:hypothetical protein CLV59_101780 [Chitinophaga dinghuensis]|uniref:Uncharacterized protein n=1 Tax=Chitinophaga dinghuensis TaxID=1539050 RepID=A0A327WBX2_9BACT|nr:hypothetical protein [Chitinophaga dinghuensis]RAJ88015.1 hypothetical protein CLV59_101780 [Chitinophaga dinghuensis]
MKLSYNAFIQEIRHLGQFQDLEDDRLQYLEDYLTYFYREMPEYWYNDIANIDLPKAVSVVASLDRMGYFRLTDPGKVNLLKLFYIMGFNENCFNAEIIWEEQQLDKRWYVVDGENLIEGGFDDQMKDMRPSFERLGVQINYRIEWVGDSPGEGVAYYYVNDHVYSSDFRKETAPGYSHWDLYGLKFILIINRELELQEVTERLYPYCSGNSLAVLILTPEQQAYIQSVTTNPRETPLVIEEWCQLFNVPFRGYDPQLYF